MQKLAFAALLPWLVACATLQQNTPQAARGVEYRNGMWFDGTKFVPMTMYVADGVFHSRAPAQVDSVVDLAGGYVVPPFADAHQHLIDPRIDQTIRAQLHDGIFYLKDQASAAIIRRMIGPMLNQPTSFDYVSANQGWTSPGGHPVQIVKRGAEMGGPFAAFVRDSLDPGIIMQVESKADIERRWSYFLAGKPDFVKIYLQGNRGIDPALVPEFVALARAAGLHVSAHVYTAADFRNAVNGGVQHIAHLPGGRGADSVFLVSEADAVAAARRGVAVVTTVVQHLDSALTERLLRTQYARNIDLLRKHRVPLLIGSDLFPGTARAEISALARSGLFSNLELLRMWSVTTPQAIFPTRRIGVLQGGYEASFLVLRTDPLRDILAATNDIVLRVKRGVPIRL